jgi:hypothetical protein
MMDAGQGTWSPKALIASLAMGVMLTGAAWSQPAGAPEPAGPAYTKDKPAYLGGDWPGGEYPFTPEVVEQQKKQFDAVLAGLQPQRPGVHDVYLLVAGLWGEHVFESEATNAAQILTERYGAQGRVVLLSNYFAGGAGLPGATPSHLKEAITKIGSLMDKEEDLLILFATSHGGKDNGMGIHDRDRMEYVMTPPNLRTALEQAGVEHRVLILSACFSGQFIPALHDQKTIVITAASAVRTSFGCRAENDWTYFGDAFFNNALRAGGGLVPAFQKARKQIGDWETRDGLTPSDPQLYVGTEAAKLLGTIEANFAAPTPAPAAP